MRIECEEDPDDIIDRIGDRYFTIDIQENLTELERQKGHAFIIDCEDGVRIEVSSDYGKEENYKIAEALIKLLNQKYRYCPVGED